MNLQVVTWVVGLVAALLTVAALHATSLVSSTLALAFHHHGGVAR
ncbi:hypothetical protein ACFQEX_24720 [Roseibium salinum]